MGPAGMALYVDGVRVGRRTDTTQGEAYLGYWRVGGDNLDGWPSQPEHATTSSARVDEVAIYPTALTQDQIIAQYEASGRTSVDPGRHRPMRYGAAVYADEPDLYWRLGETSGTTAADSGKSLNDGTYRNGVDASVPGRRGRRRTPPPRFDGNNEFVSSDGQVLQPDRLLRGGLVQDHHQPRRQDHRLRQQPDRQLRQLRPPRLHAGRRPARLRRLDRPAEHHHHHRLRYNDGQWHHVVATQSGVGHEALRRRRAGRHQPADRRPRTTPATGRSAATTPGAPRSAYFNGTIDEVAVYSYELSAATAVRRTSRPAAACSTSRRRRPSRRPTDQRRVTFDATGSTDPDGTITALRLGLR